MSLIKLPNMIASSLDTHDTEQDRGKVIESVKSILTLSLWWLCIPVYTIAIQYMKTWFLPRSFFRFNMHDLIMRERPATFFLFLILPVILIIINVFSMLRLFKLTGNYRKLKPFSLIWANALVIIISVTVMCIYFFLIMRT
jgi:hypothetical protein